MCVRESNLARILWLCFLKKTVFILTLQFVRFCSFQLVSFVRVLYTGLRIMDACRLSKHEISVHDPSGGEMRNGMLGEEVISLEALRVVILDVHDDFTVDKIAKIQAVSYPHDAEDVIKQLYPNALVKTIFLVPDLKKIISAVKRVQKSTDLFINLYDLTGEGYIGLLNYLEENGLPFTGAGKAVADVSRDVLKLVLRYAKIGTPMFLMVDEEDISDSQVNEIVAECQGFPVFVKAGHGFDSVGIDNNACVHNEAALKIQIKSVVTDWGSALVEKYVDGREFSVLVVGDANDLFVYPPVEYIFSGNRRHITFEDKWVSYKNCWQSVDDPLLAKQLCDIGKAVLAAFEGEGICRIDIRQDAESGELFVLDLNDNCSVFYKDLCTADNIVLLAGYTKAQLMKRLVEQAFRRQKAHKASNYIINYHPEREFSLVAKKDLQIGDLIYSDEMKLLRIVSKTYVVNKWKPDDLATFDRFELFIGFS